MSTSTISFFQSSSFRSSIAIAAIALSPACGGSDTPPPEVATKAESTKAQYSEASMQMSKTQAPDFTLADLSGTSHSLSSYKGKKVVLEWFNPGCPFVKYAHGKDGPLANLAKEVTQSGDTVWLAINSGAVGKQGADLKANQDAKRKWNMGYPILVDSDGTVGRAYGAKTTPHIFVIDEQGVLRYRGALDNAPLGRGKGEYKNFLTSALADLAAGKEVGNKDTLSYGCGVKY